MSLPELFVIEKKLICLVSLFASVVEISKEKFAGVPWFPATAFRRVSRESVSDALIKVIKRRY